MGLSEGIDIGERIPKVRQYAFNFMMYKGSNYDCAAAVMVVRVNLHQNKFCPNVYLFFWESCSNVYSLMSLNHLLSIV